MSTVVYSRGYGVQTHKHKKGLGHLAKTKHGQKKLVLTHRQRETLFEFILIQIINSLTKGETV